MKVLSKLNEILKSMMHFMVLITIVLGIANLLYINKVENELAETTQEVVSVENEIDKMTTNVQPGLEPMVVADPFNEEPRNNLRDILNKIEDAENNIRRDLNIRFRYR